MNGRVIFGSAATAALIALAAAGCASESDQQAQQQAQAKISKEQAEQTALANAPGGAIKGVELEEESDKLIWSCEIATPGTKNITEVNVDAQTGALISISTETPDQEAKEKD